jgi:hypothetical protein
MNFTPTVAIATSLLLLTACGGKGDDTLGDNAADVADAKADQLEDMADNAATDTQEDALDAQADATREAGEAREEAIDDSDLNAEALTKEQKEALTNGM